MYRLARPARRVAAPRRAVFSFSLVAYASQGSIPWTNRRKVGILQLLIHRSRRYILPVEDRALPWRESCAFIVVASLSLSLSLGFCLPLFRAMLSRSPDANCGNPDAIDDFHSSFQFRFKAELIFSVSLSRVRARSRLPHSLSLSLFPLAHSCSLSFTLVRFVIVFARASIPASVTTGTLISADATTSPRGGFRVLCLFERELCRFNSGYSRSQRLPPL